jgi:hypothetical protein
VGFDPLVDGDGSVIGGDAIADGSQVGSCTPMPQCPGATIPLVGSGQVNASSSPGNTGFSGSCGGVANPEVVWKLNPLSAGTYMITVTVGGPALIIVRDGCCSGPELVCGAFGQPVTITRAQGQAAFLIVESLAQSVTVQIDGI